MIKQLPQGTYKKARGRVIVNLLSGSLAGHPQTLGNVDLVRNISTTKEDLYTAEFAVKTIAFSEIDEVNAELTLTCRQMSDIVRMIENMSDVEVPAEVAAAGLTEILEDANWNEDIILDARRTANIVVSDGAAGVAVEGMHYTVQTGNHGKTIVSLLGKPAGAGTDAVVDFDRLASAADRYDLFSQNEIMAQVIYLEAEAPGRNADTHVYHRVGLTVDGDVSLMSLDSTVKTVTIKGKIYADSSKPQPLGYVEANVRAAA